MTADRIDFISAYCDRWCERCAFTDRCSAYACDIAIAMCGDVAEGIELAVGQPQPVGREKEKTIGRQLMEEFSEKTWTRAEEEAFERNEEARARRITAHPLVQMSETYMQLGVAWLGDHAERIRAAAGDALREALTIISWDVILIGVKLRRALDGRDRHQTGEESWDDDPVQNDWNGSAKVALISLDRSEAAWRTVAAVPDNAGAPVALEAITRLRAAASLEFPDAMHFKRPGFDGEC